MSHRHVRSHATAAHQPRAIAVARPAPVRLIALFALFFATFALTLLSAVSTARAHDVLVDRGVETTSSGSVESIRLSFNNEPLDIGNEAYVRDTAGTDVIDGQLTVRGRDVLIPLAADLAAGEYTGAWRVTSSDGHPIQGAFTLTIDADGTATLSDADLSDIGSGDAETDGDGDGTSSTGSASSGLGMTAIMVIISLVVIAGLVIALVIVMKRKQRKQRNS